MVRVSPIRLAILAFSFLFSYNLSAQIEFKLHWMEEENAWGVFARPAAGTNMNLHTIVGSGQVTIVAPTGMGFRDLRSVSGEWQQNAFVGAPSENPVKDYISFGLISNDPPIELAQQQETLLFTFTKRDQACPDTLYLIDQDDPMSKIPNSANANAGNDLSVLDPVTQQIYNYTGNYMPDAWNCHPGQAVPLGEYRTATVRWKAKVVKP